MEIVFFVAAPGEAACVASRDDLEVDLAAEPVRVDGPEALIGLISSLGFEGGRGMRQLRDATCQSFPVWCIGRDVASRIAELDDETIDGIAKAWHTDSDADLYEKASCLTDLRDALQARQAGERLFALLEERAFWLVVHQGASADRPRRT